MSLVQEVEIAEALLEQYLAALGQADETGSLTLRLDQEASIGAAAQTYPEIWKRLDSARTLAAGSGRDLSYYDQIRTFVGTDAAHGITSTTTTTSALGLGVLPVMVGSSKTAEGNANGIRAARDAIAVFRHTFPDQSWQASGEAVPDLRTGGNHAKIFAVVGAIVLVAALFAVRALMIG